MVTLLTVREAALRLRISRSTLYELINAGRIRTVHPTPGRTLITERVLDAFIASLEKRRVA